MLVLSRRRKQSLIIGNHIEVKILEIKNKSVLIGINAPRHINIARNELLEISSIEIKS